MALVPAPIHHSLDVSDELATQKHLIFVGFGGNECDLVGRLRAHRLHIRWRVDIYVLNFP